jgi:predicted negative regulator of RcsB-dependent stress response
MTQNKQNTVEVEVSKAIDHFWRPVFVGLVVVAVAFGAYLAYDAYSDHKETQAQEALFQIQKELDSKQKDLEKLETEALVKNEDKSKNAKKAAPKLNKDVEAKLKKTPENLESTFGDTLKKFDDFIGSNAGNKASFMAAVQVAGLATIYNDLPRAEKWLSQVVSGVKTGDLFYGLVKSQYGSVLMDLKKFSEAAMQYEDITEVKEQKYFHPQALLRLGICYIELNDPVKAEAAFARLMADHPTTQAANEAKQMKKLMALRQGEAK